MTLASGQVGYEKLSLLLCWVNSVVDYDQLLQRCFASGNLLRRPEAGRLAGRYTIDMQHLASAPGIQREANYRETAMKCSWLGLTVLLTSLMGRGEAQTTPAPSYAEIEASIVSLEKQWQGLDPATNPELARATDFVKGLRTDLQAYSGTTDADARVAALNRLHQSVATLDQTTSPAEAQVRDDLRYWLRPRIALAWAEYQTLAQTTKGSPERERWADFIEKTLRPAVGALEGAKTPADRTRAAESIDNAISTLQTRTDLPANAHSDTLVAALASLYLQPNVEVTIDHSALTSFIMPKGIVEPGPIFFKGQWSYVTPGPVQGIGFQPTADGVQIVVQQAFTSMTSIQGFEQQMEANDPRAKQATSMYRFSATTRDDAVVTMVALFQIGTGLQLAQGYQHAVNAAVNTTPVAGAGFKRMFASLLGQNQKAITDKVQQGVMAKLPGEVVSNARELSGIKSSQGAARANALFRPYVLDGQTVGANGVGITNLRLTTGSNYATAHGNLYSFDSPKPRRATFPQPRKLLSFQPGITADLHVPSVLANFTDGAFKNPEIQGITSLQIEAPAGTAAPGTAPKISRNVEFPAYLEAVQQGQQAGNASQLVRILKPSRAPDYSVASNGDLLVSIPDFQLDVPAPSQLKGGAVGGPAASVYRIAAPSVQLGLSVFLDRSNPAVPPALKAKVTSFNLDPKFSVKAIDKDEASAQPLNPIVSRVVSAGLSSKIVGQTFDLPVAALNRPDVALVDVSPLDPSGWLRLILAPRPQG